jgi:predicted CoA-substrate-specific enzyme activase
MIYVAGIDVGSTYTKALILGEDLEIAGRAMKSTGFKLAEVAQETLDLAITDAGLNREAVSYVVATGFGRHQVPFRDVNVTDLTASARGGSHLYPETRTILDVGGQTMKAIRLDGEMKVKSFRLNDKCAAGTGAFLEKTARYMGYTTEEIGPLAATSKETVPISGVCAVFAESEVINHLSLGASPADIMYGSIRFKSMAQVVREEIGSEVNVPDVDMVQYTTALGAAILGHHRLKKLQQEKGSDQLQPDSAIVPG